MIGQEQDLGNPEQVLVIGQEQDLGNVEQVLVVGEDLVVEEIGETSGAVIVTENDSDFDDATDVKGGSGIIPSQGLLPLVAHDDDFDDLEEEEPIQLETNEVGHFKYVLSTVIRVD